LLVDELTDKARVRLQPVVAVVSSAELPPDT
jgi:hypothetical protein